ncbi:MAG TPA: DUF4845 domain-containing protein [Gammaproteobacteria bacterium]|nr:DUF4845 domain-containing protein [Gammaproteobacteria bacterium]
MTAIGMLILAIIIGLIGYACLRLIPVYLEHYKVVSVLDGARKELEGQNPTRTDIRKSIEKRMVVESLNAIDIDDVKVTKEGPGYVVSTQYEQRRPFIANVSFVVSFDKTVEIAL